MLIKRKVFEALLDKVPSYTNDMYHAVDTVREVKIIKEFFATSIDASGCLLSEDYHFCELWRNNGGKIHINPFIKLEHVGTYVYGGDLIKAGGNLK